MIRFYLINQPDNKINKNLFLINKYIANKKALNTDLNKKFFKKYSIYGLS
jgi:hypothetical protein